MLNIFTVGLPTGILIGGFIGALISTILEAKKTVAIIIILISVFIMSILGGIILQQSTPKPIKYSFAYPSTIICSSPNVNIK